MTILITILIYSALLTALKVVKELGVIDDEFGPIDVVAQGPVMWLVFFVALAIHKLIIRPRAIRARERARANRKVSTDSVEDIMKRFEEA